MIGKYKYKDGVQFDVIYIRGRYERARCKDFGYRLFTKVTQEELQKELLTGEIEKL